MDPLRPAGESASTAELTAYSLPPKVAPLTIGLSPQTSKGSYVDGRAPVSGSGKREAGSDSR